jgi:hypothetical protein
MNWRFTITDYTINPSGVSVVADPPQDWQNLEVKLARDLDKHGVFFEYSLTNVTFYGAEIELMKAAYESKGIEAKSTLLAETQCAPGDDWEFFYTGNLLYNTYSYTCGEKCYISIGIEQNGCLTTFKNMADTKVDLDALVDKDGGSLPAYGALGYSIPMPSKMIKLETHLQDAIAVNVTDELYGAIPIGDTRMIAICPDWSTPTLLDIPDSNPSGWIEQAAQASGAPTAVDKLIQAFEGTTKLNDNGLHCLGGNYEINIDFRGTLLATNVATTIFDYVVLLVHQHSGGRTTYNLYSSGSITFSGTRSDSFAYTGSHTITAANGDSFYLMIVIQNLLYTTSPGTAVFDITFSTSDFQILHDSLCDPTICKSYFVNEALSRIAEHNTDNCLRVYSDYFGRTGALPYNSEADGCGGLEFITTGKMIREIQDSKLFISWKELFDGLNAIHCIGYGIETDPHRTGYNLIRVEPWYYFYQNNVLLTCDNPLKLTKMPFVERIYNTVSIGYRRFEAEQYNGLDEFLSTRQYRMNIGGVRKELSAISALVASGYAIEITRRIGNNSTKDWRYDNDVFIVCCKHSGEEIVVEQGSISSGTNLYDPPTVFNYAISPVRNLMRWFSYLITSYRNYLSPATGELIFSAGDGNYKASGLYTGACVIENQTIDENETIDHNSFASDPYYDGTIKIIPERVTFDYPLSLQAFRAIQLNPYGLVQYRCGSGDYEWGYIANLTYKPYQGLATFQLIKSTYVD